MKERALKAEAVREKALFAWQEGHDKESRELSSEIRRVKKEVAQVASANDILLKRIQGEVVPSPSSPSPSNSSGIALQSSVSFLQVGTSIPSS